MIRLIQGAGITVLTSLFYFPFVTSLLPQANTKMVMAAVGLLLMLVAGAFNGLERLRNDKLSIGVYAVAVSFVSYVSVVINNVPDYTFVTYFVSMLVWLCGAYTVIKAIDVVYGKATYRILANFLIIVCVCQCILSQIIDNNQAVADFVDRFMISTGFMGKAEGRIYGIGCALDVAGLKFSAVLIMIASLLFTLRGKNKKRMLFVYLSSFFVITLLGSMIARTTSIGALVALAYMVGYSFYKKHKESVTDEDMENIGLKWKYAGWGLLFIVPICIAGYYTIGIFRKNIEFAFEGFFSLVQTGEWKVRSNQQLESMVIWPDNLKTWLIGDGYFNSPSADAYYTGKFYEGYYMGTDVGYCRYIFYFGLIGLATISTFFINAAKVCVSNNRTYAFAFWMVLLMNFIGWYKVSSDLFPFFALFLMLGQGTEEKNTFLSAS